MTASTLPGRAGYVVPSVSLAERLDAANLQVLEAEAEAERMAAEAEVVEVWRLIEQEESDERQQADEEQFERSRRGSLEGIR